MAETRVSCINCLVDQAWRKESDWDLSSPWQLQLVLDCVHTDIREVVTDFNILRPSGVASIGLRAARVSGSKPEGCH